MRIVYWAWFDNKQEQKEFLEILHSSKSDIEAISKLCNKYPDISMPKISGVVDNFKKEIGKNYET